MASWATGSANLRTNLTVGNDFAASDAKVWMTKVTFDESFKFVHTSRVHSNVVMLINKLE